MGPKTFQVLTTDNSEKYHENLKKMKHKAKRKLEEDPKESDKLSKKQKKKDSNEQVDHKEENESLDDTVSQTRRKHKPAKKKKQKVKEIPATDESKGKAVNYLNKWKHDRQNWKFEKVRQVWLLKHMLKDAKVPDSVFPILVEYLNGAKGHARKAVLEKTLEVVRIMEKSAELSEQGISEEEITKQCPNRVSEKMYERARTILQCLQDGDE